MSIILIAIVFALSHCTDVEESNFESVVQSHLKRYPEMGIQDLYKLAFHASMGNAHFLDDTAHVLEYLRYELEQVSPSMDEPFLVNLTGDSTVVRLHLGPFKALKGNPVSLVDAMFASADQMHSSPEQLRQHWATIETMAAEKAIPFHLDSLQQFWGEIDSLGLPAVHHSPKYQSLYNPHYRLVLRSEAAQLTLDVKK